MIRHLNHTGRQRIKTEHAQVSLRLAENGSPPMFDLELDLASYSFQPEARVRVEAWHGNVIQRWEYGTAGELTPPSDQQRRMTVAPDSSQFRVIVVAGDDSGRLLGHAPRIKPRLPQGSLLPLRETDELGDEVWRVGFGDGDQPALWVNRAVGGISGIVRGNTEFRALVMPAVLRTVLTHMLVVQRANLDDDEPTWDGWFKLAQSLNPDADVPHVDPNAAADDLNESRDWIDIVVDAFARESVMAASSYNAALRD